jgi:hypothetical protein
MDASLPILTFKKIASAQSVEGKLGLATFKLSSDALAELRSLADEMNQTTSK